MQKIAFYSALMVTPLVIAGAIWLGSAMLEAERSAKFLSAFQAINEAKPPLSISQVVQLIGQPVRVEQSESADQTVTGTVYHYLTYPAGGDFRVIFVNGIVFKTAIIRNSNS